jgi:Kef-type K+ transport system membrane component KefB
VAHPTDPIALVLFWVTVIFSLGMLGRYLAQRMQQPGVLGELLMGVLLGNLCYYFSVPEIVILREGSTIFNIVEHLISGLSLSEALNQSVSSPVVANVIEKALHSSAGADSIKVAYALDIFSRYGVIFLLFMVGLESSVEEIKQTGRASLTVAFLGVIAPLLLGLMLMCWLLPEAGFNAHLFVGATLTATSVGITARVLKEMKKIHTIEAKTILGAAMIDDVLGLMLLAVVTSLMTHGHVEGLLLLKIIGMTCLFFGLVIYLGPRLIRLLVKCFSFLPAWEAKLLVAFIFSMTLSWLATWVQLASIIGAFSAGLVLHDAFFNEKPLEKGVTIKDVMAPLELLLAPLFFMLIGIQVKLETFLDIKVLEMALGLMIVAVLGKLLSGLGAARGSDKLLVGVGMLPRGEVGLVFASLGRASGVISDALFSAIILMVIMTTFIAPVWLKACFMKKRHA